MKIAQVAPLAESVPPKLYGGTERIVGYLTEELVRQGHDVTLFAAGDSITSAKLVPCTKKALRLNVHVRDPIPYTVMMLEEVRRRAGEFDVIHFHIDLLQFAFARGLPVPHVTTLHGRQDLPDLAPFFRMFRELPLVSISHDQRRPLPKVNWAGNVYHGLPRDLLQYSSIAEGGYLAFLGRIAPEKRPDRAIEIAVRAGWPLKIAAKVDKVDQAYWQEKIRPMVTQYPNIEYIGEIGDAEKAEFLGNAAALLFPIDWPEPFGLVMIEAMACGTPVIAFHAGSVPEVIDDGISGFVVETVQSAVDALGRLESLERGQVRDAFERRFTVERMAADYVSIYQGLTSIEAEEHKHVRDVAKKRFSDGFPERDDRVPARAA